MVPPPGDCKCQIMGRRHTAQLKAMCPSCGDRKNEEHASVECLSTEERGERTWLVAQNFGGKSKCVKVAQQIRDSLVRTGNVFFRSSRF